MSDPLTLDEVDRQGRAAADALHARIAALVDADVDVLHAAPPPPSPLDGDAPHTGGGDDDHREGEHVLVAVDADGRHTGRSRRRTRWLAVAAAAALVAAVATVVTRDPRTDVSSDQPSLLVPTAAPAGMDLTHVAVLDGTAAADAVEADISVYGDPTTADPWAGPLLSVFRQRDVDEASLRPTWGDSVTIDVRGHDAILRRASASAEEPAELDGWQIQWVEGEDQVIIAGIGGLDREDVIAAAEAVDDDEIATDGLPDGFEPLAQGPLDSAVDPMALMSLPYSTGLVLTYMPPGGADDGPFVSVLQRPGSAASVDMLRFAFPDSGPIEIRGHHGVVGRRDEHVAVQWLERDGQLVTVRGAGVSEEELVAVAEGLAPASTDEVEALVASGPGPLGPVAAGESEVAAGRTPAGSDWRLVVGPDSAEGLSGLTLEDGSGSTSMGVARPPGEAPALELTSVALDDADVDAASTLVYGTVTAEASEVVLEAPGHSPLVLDRRPVDGWSRLVVALVVLTADLTGASVVARAADGSELQRAPVA